MAVALITGGSRGLGWALARGLLADPEAGWSVVIDGRDAAALAAAAEQLSAPAAAPAGGPPAAPAGGTAAAGTAAAGTAATVVAIPGDVTDPAHRRALVEAAERLGGLDLLVNNASLLGPSPQPRLEAYPVDALARVYDVNVVAPLAMIQEALPALRGSPAPRIVNVTSDAAVEPYEGWGGYGSSKAALDHLSAILGAEEPTVRVWAVDPGDLRTQMHQEAFPGEDISDRPEPETVVPAFLSLIASDRPSGRVRLAEVPA